MKPAKQALLRDSIVFARVRLGSGSLTSRYDSSLVFSGVPDATAALALTPKIGISVRNAIMKREAINSKAPRCRDQAMILPAFAPLPAVSSSLTPGRLASRKYEWLAGRVDKAAPIITHAKRK